MELSKTENKSYREDILQYAAERYGTCAEYLWKKAPGYAVLRHEDNKKWYAVIMNVQRDKLGCSGRGSVDALEIKCEPMMKGSLLLENGILPAYHMHRGNWITLLLDGSLEKSMVISLLDMSFDITSSKTTGRTLNKEWLVPANPKYFDLEKAFSESEIILWKQSSNIIVGDTVYIYVGAPVSAVQYRCMAIEVDIPYRYNDGKLSMSRVMRLKLEHRFTKEQLSFNELNEYGIYAVRGPRSVPDRLHRKIESLCSENPNEK